MPLQPVNGDIMFVLDHYYVEEVVLNLLRVGENITHKTLAKNEPSSVTFCESN